MFAQLISSFERSPLKMILILALGLRLCAVVFSKGYAMHDDHFLVVEVPESILDGYDYAIWKPENNGGNPQGHSLFYTGFQYLLLATLDAVGIDDPQSKMFVIRLIHALLSLLLVVAGYRITERLGTEKDALVVGLLLAAFWPMPFLSVRNLIEYIATIPLLWATWIMVRNGVDDTRAAVLSGLLCGMAMGIRFQLVLFIGGWGLAMWMMRKWKNGSVYGLCAAFGFFLTQLGDLVWWEWPLTEIWAYIDYNLINSTTYFDRPWYQYILTLFGILIPPISLFLIYGTIRIGKRHLILSIPVLVFFLFHSYFPNKQERFILPILPYVFILGVIGFNEFRSTSGFWQKSQRLWKGLLGFFLVLNTAALFLLTFTYMKKSRVESMYFLYQQEDYNNAFFEYSHRDGYMHYPQFYSNAWYNPHRITKTNGNDFWVKKLLPNGPDRPGENMGNYVLFFDEESLEERKRAFIESWGPIEYETTIHPGNFDKLLHWLNDHNKYELVEIYRLEEF